MESEGTNTQPAHFMRPAPRYTSDLLSRKEAAAYLGVSKQTLAIWKCTGRYNLPTVRIGRLIKYRLADLDKFISERLSSG